MDDILKSIRRIIRSDHEEGSASIKRQKLSKNNEKIENQQQSEEDNLIQMEIQDRKRVRILEKKLQTIEMEYEQKLTLHRRKMSEYRHENKQLAALVEDCKSKLKMVTSGLKSAHDCLEKLDADNKNLSHELQRMKKEEHGSVVLKTIQTEFINLYHPERVKGDHLSKAVRQEIYNEFSEVLQGVRNRLRLDTT